MPTAAPRRMPAYAFEVDEAEAEGVELNLLTNPVRILGDGEKVTGVELVRMRLASRTRVAPQPIPIEGSNYDRADGGPGDWSGPDLAFLPGDVRVTRRGTLTTMKPRWSPAARGLCSGDAATGAQPCGHRHTKGRRSPSTAICPARKELLPA